MLQKKIKLQRAQRRMPWYMAPKKDVTSCEKLRRGANILRPVDIRMRELSASNIALLRIEQYRYVRGTRGTETSKYPEEKKANSDSESSGERNWNSPNQVNN